MLRRTGTVIVLFAAGLVFWFLAENTDARRGPNDSETSRRAADEERPAAAARPVVFTDADYARHIEKLRKKISGGRFTIVLQRPFVVIGDESPEIVEQRAEHTVKWAVDLLKKSYFEKDPDEILDIWLFRDKKSYEENAAKLFQCKPSTPFGYYSHSDRALVMNINTGGGTLVHEIVHPLCGLELSQMSRLVQRGPRLALRTKQQPRRQNSRPHQLAAGGPTGGHSRRAGAFVSNTHRNHRPASFTKKIPVPTTLKHDTFATIYKSTISWKNTITAFGQTIKSTPPAIKRCKKSWAAATCRLSIAIGKPM